MVMRALSRYLQQLLRRKVRPVVGPVLGVEEVLGSHHVELVEHHVGAHVGVREIVDMHRVVVTQPVVMFVEWLKRRTCSAIYGCRRVAYI